MAGGLCGREPLDSEGGDQSVESWCFDARAVMMSKDFARGL